MPYVYVGPHPETLVSGQLVGLDEIVRDKDLDLETAHDAELVDKGWLLKQTPATKNAEEA